MAGATRYRVAWSTSNDLTSYAALRAAGAAYRYFWAMDANPVTLSIQLTSGTTYWFVVTAWNVDGESEPSAAVSSAKQ